MTRAQALQLMAGVAWIIAAGFLAAERRLIRQLRRQGATHAGASIPVEVRSPFVRARLWRLKHAEAVVETAPGDYYLSAEGYAGYRRRRRRRVILILSVALPVTFAVVQLMK